MADKSELLRAFKSIGDPVSVDVGELCPERVLPEWISRFQKGKAQRRGSRFH